jgi:methionyl-tRNA formyltransferase
MKIVAWVCNQSNQMALLNKIHDVHPLAAIVVESPVIKRKITVKLLFNAIIERLFLRKSIALWKDTLSYYAEYNKTFPNVPILHVENINSEETYNYSNNQNADLIIVSGTRLIRKRLLEIKPKTGIINLHTGVSPYIKGGPNCTNWCIATKQFHLIGNTIMWLDAGIDTGNIITTDLTSLNGNETLLQIHIKVMDHAHSLYLMVIDELSKNRTVPSVNQNTITKGNIYYNKNWTAYKKYLLLKNYKIFKKISHSSNFQKQKEGVKLVNLN